MSGWSSWGIRRKLFTAVLMILICNAVVLLFMGSTLFEVFYMNSKVANLKDAAKRIRKEDEGNSETFYDEISSIENENALVALFMVEEDGKIAEIYRSRPQKMEELEHELEKFPPFLKEKHRHYEEMQGRLRARLLETGEDSLIELGKPDGREEREEPWDNSISLSCKLDDGLYLYIYTPRDYIRSTAELAVKYTALLSIGILLAGSVLIYLLAARMTRPLNEIRTVAGKIAQMDFSQKCRVHGGDEIAQIAGSINDMSEQLEAGIEKLVEANEVLQNDLLRQQQTDRMRQQFVASVSHDFKTPITLMVSYAEAMENETSEAARREYCETIISEGNRLSHMVGRMLDLSKLENGIDKVECSIFCLSEVVDGAMKNYRLPTSRRGIEVRREIEDEFIVEADYHKIERVVANLFENAVKYVPDGGEIRVIVHRNGGCCRVGVENTGEPIREEEIESLFDSFYRADQSRSCTDGYGLGLAIVKVIMEAHNQRYGVENTGTGVRFWFELPLVEVEDPEEDGEEDDQHP